MVAGAVPENLKWSMAIRQWSMKKNSRIFTGKAAKGRYEGRKTQVIMGVEDFAFHTMEVKNKKPPLDTTTTVSYNEQRKAMKETSTHRANPQKAAG